MSTQRPEYDLLIEQATALQRRIAEYDTPPIPHRSRSQPQTAGERAADAFVRTIGSWRFIVLQTVVLAAWVTLNVVGIIRAWDPYPFILLNLMLSFQAAYAGPIIMMSQNRSSEMDRLQAQADYLINGKAELEVEQLLTLMRAQLVLTEAVRKDLDQLRVEG